jgi:hypothetical protein
MERNVNTCKTSKHWEVIKVDHHTPKRLTQYGRCEEIYQDSNSMIVPMESGYYGDEVADVMELLTHPDFGCIRHESK